MQNVANFVEFTWIYLNSLECVIRKRTPDRPTDPWTDRQSILYSCFSQLKSKTFIWAPVTWKEEERRKIGRQTGEQMQMRKQMPHSFILVEGSNMRKGGHSSKQKNKENGGTSEGQIFQKNLTFWGFYFCLFKFDLVRKPFLIFKGNALLGFWPLEEK